MKILIADEHPLARMVLKRRLQSAFSDLELEEAESVEVLLKKSVKQKWDLIISDLFSPVQTGLSIIKQIKKRLPSVPVLIFTMVPVEQYAFKTLASGSSGYLTREDSSWELIKAVKTILSGKKYLPLIVSDMLEMYREERLIESKAKISSNWYFKLTKVLAEGKNIPNLKYNFC